MYQWDWNHWLKIIIIIMQYLLGQAITQQNRYLHVKEFYEVKPVTFKHGYKHSDKS